jgi:hypothetical protein
VRRVAVPPLDDVSAAALVGRVTGAQLPGPAVSQVVSRAGGNPFFLTEVARLLLAHGPDGAMVVPPGVREVLQRRLARLSQACSTLLGAAAIVGETATAAAGRDRVDNELLATICGLDPSAVAELLDEAGQARLVDAQPGPPAGVRFAHALVREVLVADLSATQRARLHRQVAETLAARGAHDADGDLVERLAYHWARAAGPDAPQRAGHAALRAARVAVDNLGFEQAATHLRQALHTAGIDRVDVLIQLGHAQRLAGDLPAARDTLLSAAKLAADAGRAEALAAAALELGGGIAGFEVPIADQEQIAVLQQAQSLLTVVDSALRAAVLARLSLALTGYGTLGQRRGLAEQAVAMAERVGDRAVTAAALAAYCDAVAGPDYVAQRLSSAERMLALAGGRVAILLARRLRLVAELEAGDFAAAVTEIGAYQRAADDAGIALYQWFPAVWRGMQALLRGDIEGAFTHADTAEQIGARAGSGNAAILVFTLRMHTHLAAGTTATYADHTRELLGDAEQLPLPLTYLAAPTLLLLASGDTALGRVMLRRFLDTPAPDITDDAEWLEGHWALAAIAVALDDRKAAARLLATLRPYERLWAVDGIGAAVLGTVGHQLGQLAALLGRHREAVGFLQTAHHTYTEAGAPLLAAQVHTALDRLGAPTPPAPSRSDRPGRSGQIRREGGFWRLTWNGQVSTVPHGKGIRDLATLLAQPGRPVSALDLVEAGGGRPAAFTGGDLGPVLDATARRAYQTRIIELDDEIATAEAGADLARAEQLRAERDMIATELGNALGLGGRSRTMGDPVERARKAVTMRIRATIRGIEAADAGLGRHLRNAVKTGRMCVYEPDTEVTWRT